MDDLSGRYLLGGVVAVAADGVDGSGSEQASLVVPAECPDAELGQLREFADGQAGAYDSTVHHLPGETQPAGRGLTLSLRETAGWPYDRCNSQSGPWIDREITGDKVTMTHYFNVADGHLTLLLITHNSPTPAWA